LAVLFDVPGVSQRWYYEADGSSTEPDGIGCLVLSGTTLVSREGSPSIAADTMAHQALSVVANLLLILRFSNRLNARLTLFSALIWVCKTIVGRPTRYHARMTLWQLEAINLSVFGHREDAVWDQGICELPFLHARVSADGPFRVHVRQMGLHRHAKIDDIAASGPPSSPAPVPSCCSTTAIWSSLKPLTT
jgi:hypothetical protein